MNTYQSVVEELLQPAGILINDANTHSVIVHDERFYRRILRDGSLGLGESYMDGWWDCDAPDEFLYRLLNSGLENQVKKTCDCTCKYLKHGCLISNQNQ
jgi:cyclopropane-fatty-acyl-phospholipid synthase